ncbi:MAG: hypothetical protein OEX83_10630, partial [Gammaproteobacteria bacterium]|nr:hypothetical protein [Gammaproteobacteria bacterium]
MNYANMTFRKIIVTYISTMTSGLLMIAVLSGCDGSASANPGAGDNNQEYSYEWIPETVSGERYYSLGDEYTISVLP